MKTMLAIKLSLIAVVITLMMGVISSACTPDDIVPEDGSQFKTIYLPIEFKFMGVNFEYSYVYTMTNKETGEIGWGEQPSQHYNRAIHTLITEYDIIKMLNIVYKPCGIQFYRHAPDEVLSYEQLDKLLTTPYSLLPFPWNDEEEAAINTLTIYFIGDSQFFANRDHPLGPMTDAGRGDISCSGWVYVMDSYDIGMAPAFFEYRLHAVIDEIFYWGGKDEHDYEGIRNSVENAVECRFVRRLTSDHPL